MPGTYYKTESQEVLLTTEETRNGAVNIQSAVCISRHGGGGVEPTIRDLSIGGLWHPPGVLEPISANTKERLKLLEPQYILGIHYCGSNSLQGITKTSAAAFTLPLSSSPALLPLAHSTQTWEPPCCFLSPSSSVRAGCQPAFQPSVWLVRPALLARRLKNKTSEK